MAKPELYRPVKSPGDFPADFWKKTGAFAHDFRLLAELIEKAGRDSEAFTLYISTCRNVYLTINGIFLDIKDSFGTVSPSNGLFGVLQEGADGYFAAMVDHLQTTLISLVAIDDKQNCWNKRNEWQKLLKSLIETFHHDDKALLKATLDEVVIDDQESEQETVRHFLAFDLTESSKHRSLIQRLLESKEKLRCVRTCAVYIYELSEELKRDSAIQPLLFGPSESASKQIFVDWYNSKKGNSEMEIINTALARFPAGWEMLSRSEDAKKKIEFLRTLARYLQDAMLAEYDSISKTFRLNVGRRPLPSVFLIDLSEPRPPKPDGERVAIPTPLNFSHPPIERLVVAIAQPPVPATVISASTCRYRDDEGSRQIVTQWALAAVARAAQEKAQLIVFPELFIPEDSFNDILESAKKANIGLIGGSEGHSDLYQEEYSNYAHIFIPEAPQCYREFKKYPSNYEPSNFHTKKAQYCFFRSSIGSFSVIICSDLREFDVIAAVESEPFLDYIIVCSCNPYPFEELWKHIAVADAARLHSFVIISNWSKDRDSNGFGRGTFCAGPTKKIEAGLENKPKDVIPIGAGSLVLHELDIAALFRNREKPQEGFLAPPHRRLHINK